MNFRGIVSVFLLTGLIWLAVPQQAVADYLGGVTFSHPSPSHLPHGELVYVDIDYKVDDPNGGYIYARPYTMTSPTPGYGASGGFLAMGTGTATRSFSINSGENIVTHVRIYVVDAVTFETELEMFVPVRFIISSRGVFNLQMNHNQYDRLPHGEQLVIDFDYVADVPSDCRIYARPFTNGTLTPGYLASFSSDLPPSGSYSQYFFFNNDADVTDIRFQIQTVGGVILHEIFVPFDIHWREVGIYDITFDWPAETSFHHTQNLVSSFIFDHDQPAGMRVWTTCYTGGVVSPGADSQFTLLVADGGVPVSRTARINTGETDVDGIHFRVRDAASNLVDEFTIPVDYHWGPHAIQNPVFSPASPAILSNGEPLEMTFDYQTSFSDGVRIFAAPAHNDEMLTAGVGSGSFLYPPPAGNVSYWVSFNFGDHMASQVRCFMTPSDPSEELFHHFYSGFWAWGTSNYITPVPEQVPTASSTLHPCFPNPFNPTTTIPVYLARESHVRLTVYDLRGRLVRTLQDNTLSAGDHVFTFRGDGLSSGGYVCRLETPDGVKTQRVTLVK